MTVRYAAWFMGQFGTVGSSMGVVAMAAAARKHGWVCDVFNGVDVLHGYSAVLHRLKLGYKVALIGYSEGVGDVGYLEQRLKVDLCIGLDPSRDCTNYKLVDKNCPTSVLFHNSDWLTHLTGVGGAGEASDPGGDLGFKIKHEINENHLVVDLDQSIQALVARYLAAV